MEQPWVKSTPPLYIANTCHANGHLESVLISCGLFKSIAIDEAINWWFLLFRHRASPQGPSPSGHTAGRAHTPQWQPGNWHQPDNTLLEAVKQNFSKISMGAKNIYGGKQTEKFLFYKNIVTKLYGKHNFEPFNSSSKSHEVMFATLCLQCPVLSVSYLLSLPTAQWPPLQVDLTCVHCQHHVRTVWVNTALHSTALYCNVCTQLKFTVLHSTPLHYTALHCTTLHYTALHARQWPLICYQPGTSH